MSVLVDTSAFYALLNRNDQYHQSARKCWNRLLDDEELLVTHNYILVETHALVQNRLGREAVSDFESALLAPVKTRWIEEEIHDRAIEGVLASDKRSVSLVDRTSFVLMRERQIARAFCFDHDFEQAGFQCVPSV